MASRRRSPALLAAVSIVVLGLSAVACSGSDGAGSDATTSAAPTDNVPPAGGGPGAPAFRDPGPFEVGVTTLHLGDRPVEVWYPARQGSTVGRPAATYSQLDALPPDLAAVVPQRLPASVPLSALTVTMTDTFRDVPGSANGPFPLVLYSHGFGSFRLEASALLRGIASWGFVVAAPEHSERDLAALLSNPTLQQQPTDEAGKQAAIVESKAQSIQDIRTLLDTIPLVKAAGGPLAGLADTTRVAAVGGSAGGRAVLTALSLRQIRVAVAWAATGRTAIAPKNKPSLIIAARRDVLVPAAVTEKIYADLRPPKRLVIIDGAGHSSFTDRCPAVKGGSDLVGLGLQVGLPISSRLGAGAKDGCGPLAIDPGLLYGITLNFTVAELREGLGLDDSGAGLGQGATSAFLPAVIEYRQQLK